MNKLQFALQFLKAGISIIPLYHRSKEPALRSWIPYTEYLPSEQEVYQWLVSDWYNYGVVCGWNNLVVLDFDNLEYFDLWQLWGNSIGLNVDGFYKVLTSRGIHVYLTTVQPCVNDKRVGIDVQAQRRFVVGPGCVHPSGTQYVPVGEFRLVEVESVAAVLPVELFPKVVQNVSVCDSTAFQNMPPLIPHHTEYEPFQAAMFPDDRDLISKVKSRVRIESFFNATYKTSADGRWLATLCIFHNDHHPSMWIDTKLQICGCNVCGFKPMDCINLYSRIHNLDNAAAVTALAREIGVWA